MTTAVMVFMLVVAGAALGLSLAAVAGMVVKLTEALAALTLQVRAVTAVLSVHGSAVTAAASAQTQLARSVMDLTATLKQPLRVETSADLSALKDAPTKGTH